MIKNTAFAGRLQTVYPVLQLRLTLHIYCVYQQFIYSAFRNVKSEIAQ